MKKILMITYSFPPKGGGGVLRQFKFAKYLPHFQWRPYIMTGEKFYYFQDKGLLDELPAEYRIYRIPFPDPRNFFQANNKKNQLYLDSNRPIKSRTNLRIIVKNTLFYLKSFINSIFVPDIYINWIPFAVFKGFWIIKKENIDVIYSIDNPYSNHVLAYILKILTHKPWLADFKDPWINNFDYRNPKTFPFSWLDYQLHKLILAHCDICICSDRRIENTLKTIISKSKQDKIRIISNGFDQEDFRNQHTHKRENKIFTITYVGTVYRSMPPDTFLRAVFNLIKSNIIPDNSLKIIFVGAHEYSDTRENHIFKLLVEKNIIQEVGIVSHKESINYMLSSDALLLISALMPDSENIVPSKLYEYLAAGKPIIALVDPNGRCAEFIRHSNSGYTIAIDDEKSIREAVLNLFFQFKNNGQIKMEQNRNIFDPYERKNLSRCLSDVLDNLIKTL